MSSARTIHLVDASPYIFRAFFSMPSSLVAPDGAPVGAVYGYAGFLLKLIEEEAVSHLAVAFDRSLTTSFRNEIYPPYKAQRELPPADLEAQLAACEELSAALGAVTFSDERYEADDLIGTLAARLTATSDQAVIVTSDKDLCQLVGDRVELLDFAKGQRFDAAGVVEKFGVRPEQIADYLGLAGDSVDNIPGVKGVGAKTAAALLEHFDSLEALYGDLEAVAALPIRGAKSLGARLEAARETAHLSKELATVALDAPAPGDFDSFELRGARRDQVESLSERLGFKSLPERVRRWAD